MLREVRRISRLSPSTSVGSMTSGPGQHCVLGDQTHRLIRSDGSISPQQGASTLHRSPSPVTVGPRLQHRRHTRYGAPSRPGHLGRRRLSPGARAGCVVVGPGRGPWRTVGSTPPYSSSSGARPCHSREGRARRATWWRPGAEWRRQGCCAAAQVSTRSACGTAALLTLLVNLSVRQAGRTIAEGQGLMRDRRNP